MNILTKINADQDLEDRFKILWNRLTEIKSLKIANYGNYKDR